MEQFFSMSHNCQYEHQGRCKATIISNETIATTEQTLMDEPSIELAVKEAELSQAHEDFRANDTMTAITSDVFHLKKSREKCLHNEDVAERKVRCSRFLLELSKAIVSQIDAHKPFAEMTLEEVRSRIGLEDTSKVACLSDTPVFRTIRILRNFGLHCNPNFLALWRPEGWRQ
jgi:hypothetical protein